ncbi:MAG: hypothetical protein AB1497_07875 [Bacillota bacterium]
MDAKLRKVDSRKIVKAAEELLFDTNCIFFAVRCEEEGMAVGVGGHRDTMLGD